jgi:hypothetical protein
MTIPTPCYEDWNAMTPNEQGRHCNACAKTVVDFTSMSDDAVKHFFINKKEERVCGRFRNQQLHCISIELPQNIFYIPMPVWKKFLVASLIVFSSTLFSCDTTVKGKVDNTEATTGVIICPIKGSPAIEDTTSSGLLPKPTIKGYTQSFFITSVTQGDVMLAPDLPQPEYENVLQADSLVIKSAFKNIQDSMGIIEFDEQDTLKRKDPLKADAVKCDTQIYSKL